MARMAETRMPKEITVKHCKSMRYEVEGVGSPDRTRTYNPPVNSRMLYQLSY